MLTRDDLLEIVQPLDAVERRIFLDMVDLLDCCLPFPPSEEELHEDVKQAMEEASK